MIRTWHKTAFVGLAFMLTAGTGSAQAAERLTLYCSPQIEWCQLMVEAFTKETGIDVAMTRKSSGETFAQIKAEASNPRGDVWWGGACGSRSIAGGFWPKGGACPNQWHAIFHCLYAGGII